MTLASHVNVVLFCVLIFLCVEIIVYTVGGGDGALLGVYLICNSLWSLWYRTIQNMDLEMIAWLQH